MTGIYQRTAERGNGKCTECGQNIIREEVHVRLYSAHHSVGIHTLCAIKLFKEKIEKWENQL